MEPQERILKDNTRLVIREGVAEDAAALLEFASEIFGQTDFLSYGPEDFELTEVEERKFVNEFYESPNQVFLLGLIEERIVATLHFSALERPRMQHTGEFGVAVAREFWNRGVGSRMIDALVDWARSTNLVTKINLRVRSDNRRAIALYEKKGFVCEGTIRCDVRVNGQYYDHLWMGLIL